LERSVLTPALLFVALGCLVSPAGVGWVSFGIDNVFVELLAEIALAVILFGDASRIDLQKLRTGWAVPARLLGIGLPVMVAAGWAIAILLFPALPIWSALVLAIVLAPTDAVLAQSVLANDHVPGPIRQAINVESGLNDGIALPFLLIALFLAGAGADAQPNSIGGWAAFVGISILLGAGVGVALGAGAGWLVRRAHEAGWISPMYLRLSSVAMALLAFGCAELMGANGFIAAWAAGLVIGNVAREVCARLHEFGEAEGQLLTILVIFVFGGAMLPAALEQIDWRILVYGALSLTVVRMVPVALAMTGTNFRISSIAFLGWFGPRGVASILYFLIAVAGAGFEGEDLVLGIATVTIGLSILLHGITAAPLANLYAAWLGRFTDESAPERRAVEELATWFPKPVSETPKKRRAP
jgi:NhaP-type Na+/H+ or K+/H+ antiporter